VCFFKIKLYQHSAKYFLWKVKVYFQGFPALSDSKESNRHLTKEGADMQVSSANNVNTQMAMKMVQQTMQQQQQMAEATIQMAQAQESVQNGQNLLGSGAIVDVYV
jgi:hypothetical protein